MQNSTWVSRTAGRAGDLWRMRLNLIARAIHLLNKTTIVYLAYPTTQQARRQSKRRHAILLMTR